MDLTPVQRKFVLHWGEMGTRWGINRTMAQMHALLFISPEPLNAEQITEALGVARSHVSTSLRELQSWGVIRVVHVMGDRRDHFECLQDVWEMFQTVMDERKRREIDPTVALLRECVAEAEKAGKGEVETHRRLRGLLGFFETMSGWYEQVRALPTPVVVKLVKMGSRVRKLVGAGR